MRRRPPRGVTVLELVIVLFLVMVVVMGIVLTMTRVQSQLWMRSDIQMNNWTAARQAMNRVEDDLRQASWRTVTCAVSQLEFRRISQPNVLFTYYVDGSQQLVRGDGVNAPAVMASGISQFRCRAGSGLIGIELIAGVPSTKGLPPPQTLMRQIQVLNP